MVAKNRVLLASASSLIWGSIFQTPMAHADCQTAEQLGAVPLESVEPSGDADGTFAIYWKAHLPWALKSDLAPALGSEFDIIRCIPPGKWVFLGAGQVRSLTGSLGEGYARSVTFSNTSRSGTVSEFEARSSNLYWRPMGGDIILPRQYSVSERQRITPRETFGYQSVFIREKGNTFSIELSETGKKSIAAVVNKMRGATGRLGVECFSNRPGNREDLREDTQIRANIIAQHIAQSFGLREESVVAIGLGSSALASDAREVRPWPIAADFVDGITIRILPE